MTAQQPNERVKQHAVVLVDGPFDGDCPVLRWPPPAVLLYRDEPYIWLDKADEYGRPMYVHDPEQGHEWGRVYEGTGS